MSLSIDERNVLNAVAAEESISWEKAYSANEKSVHAAFTVEAMAALEGKGLVIITDTKEKDGIERVSLRITPAGIAALKDDKEQRCDTVINRIIAITALVVSVISLILTAVLR